MLIHNLWDSFFSDANYGSQGYAVSVSAASPKIVAENELLCTPPETIKTVDEEVNALARHIGGITSGQRIQITLRELLEIIPHTRRRSDSYASLIKKLKTDHDVDLEIIKRKNEKIEQKKS